MDGWAGWSHVMCTSSQWRAPGGFYLARDYEAGCWAVLCPGPPNTALRLAQTTRAPHCACGAICTRTVTSGSDGFKNQGETDVDCGGAITVTRCVRACVRACESAWPPPTYGIILARMVDGYSSTVPDVCSASKLQHRCRGRTCVSSPLSSSARCAHV